MKRIILSFLLALAIAPGAFAQQGRAQVGYPMPEGTGGPCLTPVSNPAGYKTDAFQQNIVIDYLSAENKPKSKPSTWARALNSQAFINPRYLGTSVVASDDPNVLIEFSGMGMKFNHFVKGDSSLYTIPDNYTIQDFSFFCRHVMHRLDGLADSITIRVYPMIIDVNNIPADTVVDFTNKLKEVILAPTDGNYTKAVDHVDAQGNAFFYITQSPITATINQAITPANNSVGYFVTLNYKGASVDTLMMLSYGYYAYNNATNPPTLIDTMPEKTHYPNSYLARTIRDKNTLAVKGADLLNLSAIDRFSPQFRVTSKVGWDTTSATAERFDGTVSVGEIFPNPAPAAAEALLPFKTTVAQNVGITVYNTLGQQVRNYSYNNLMAGSHRLTIATEGLAPGIYFVRLQSPGLETTKRMLVH